jgi:NAD(P)-dependent dehydrogenase (short-subunit alcohol dehydrogenase family)
MSNEGGRSIKQQNPFSATMAGLLDLFSHKADIEPVDPDLRLEGTRCLITGASAGLGRAVATDLARRGASLLLACRSGIPEVGEAIRSATDNPEVEMLPVDLADLDSVTRLADHLRDAVQRGSRPFDVTILNAGLMPRRARRTPQGYEVMFAVHFLANRLLLARLFADGAIVPRNPEAEGRGAKAPRIVFVASNSHLTAPPIDFDRFGEFVDYGVLDGMKQYGATKLHMVALACELSRRLEVGGKVEVGVHALCPGAVASNIAREAPVLIRPVLGPIMRGLFRSPENAAAPVVYLACAPEIDEQTGLYLHMLKHSAPSEQAADPEVGRRVWEESAKLLAPYLGGVHEPV